MATAMKERPRLHSIWSNMRTRCCNPNFDKYHLYGGRNIRICDEWKDFDAFADWAMRSGYQDGLTLDRIDNDAGYSPDNCRWVTQKAQCNNKRNNRHLSYNGETKTVSEWADQLGMNYFTLHDRITKLGWSAERALTTKPNLGGQR